MKASTRDDATILHIDMDSFFVSVELLDKPQLIGKPVAVANPGFRSVVTSASYEARRFGVKSAMPAGQAKKLCPNIIFVPPNSIKYQQASKKIMQILKNVTPMVEQLSIDEAFLDISGVQKLLGTPQKIATLIRKKLKEECGLPASVGIANNKFVAKLASTKAKPDGVLYIPESETIPFLHALPISDLWGVGPATAKLLRSYAINTVADLANESIASLNKILGKAAANKLKNLSQGIDTRQVEPEVKEKSIGHENTFIVDLTETADIEKQMLDLSWRTATKLRDKQLESRTIAIKVRWHNFETITRSKTLNEATNSADKIYRVSKALLNEVRYAPLGAGKPIRLLGVRAEGLTPLGTTAQTLWDEDETDEHIFSTIDSLRKRFGPAVIKPATLITKTENEKRIE